MYINKSYLDNNIPCSLAQDQNSVILPLHHTNVHIPFIEGTKVNFINIINKQLPIKLTKLLILQQLLIDDSQSQENRLDLSRYGIFKATDAEIKKFKQIKAKKLVRRALRLHVFVKYNGQFLYRVNADLLSGQKIAFYELYNRHALNDDLHASLNFILFQHYHYIWPTTDDAIKALKTLEIKANKLFAATTDEEKAKVAKDKARFTAMLHQAVDYIENTQPGNKALPPLFETSKGEKRRSKLAFSVFMTLGVITLAIALTAGLAYGGIIILPTLLAWITPIAFTLLVAAATVSAISFIAAVAEVIKPKANKYFWQALGRGLQSFANKDLLRERVKLYNEVSKPDNAIDNYRAMKNIASICAVKSILVTSRHKPKAGIRLEKLDKILVAKQPAQDVIHNAQEYINNAPQKQNTDGSPMFTRFVSVAYSGFNMGIFTKPTSWPENMRAFKAKSSCTIDPHPCPSP